MHGDLWITHVNGKFLEKIKLYATWSMWNCPGIWVSTHSPCICLPRLSTPWIGISANSSQIAQELSITACRLFLLEQQERQTPCLGWCN